MSNRIEKMLAKSAGVRPARDIPQDEIVASNRPKTAVGMTAALQAAQLKIAELEERDSLFLPLAAIRPNPWQPRRVFDPEQIKSLAESIAEVGLIQPIVVRRVPPGDTVRSGVGNVPPGDTSLGGPGVSKVDTFDLIAGERRLRAHQLLGRTEIKAVVVEATDDLMALMALSENIDREDLSDYEVSIAIRRAETEFPNRKTMAEALGMSRSDFYRYLAFEKLPDFVIADLESQPLLLGRKAAEGLQTLFKDHPEAGIEPLRKYWPQVVAGTLDAARLPEVMATALRSGKSVRTERDIKKLFVGKEQAGSITRDAAALTVKIRAAALSQAKEEQLRTFVQELLQRAD